MEATLKISGKIRLDVVAIGPRNLTANYAANRLRFKCLPSPVVIDMAGLRAPRTLLVMQQGTDAGKADVIVNADGAAFACTVNRDLRPNRTYVLAVELDLSGFQAVEEGTSVEVNGKSVAGPAIVARSSGIGRVALLDITDQSDVDRLNNGMVFA